MTTFTTDDRQTAEKIKNILDGEKITTDDTNQYELSTHEKQAEFEKKRNYNYDTKTNSTQNTSR
jgi:hypothetical protein